MTGPKRLQEDAINAGDGKRLIVLLLSRFKLSSAPFASAQPLRQEITLFLRCRRVILIRIQGQVYMAFGRLSFATSAPRLILATRLGVSVVR